MARQPGAVQLLIPDPVAAAPVGDMAHVAELFPVAFQKTQEKAHPVIRPERSKGGRFRQRRRDARNRFPVDFAPLQQLRIVEQVLHHAVKSRF